MWRGQTVAPAELAVKNIPIELLPEETRTGQVLRIEDVALLPHNLPFKLSLQEHSPRVDRRGATIGAVFRRHAWPCVAAGTRDRPTKAT